jgi:xanthine dehydrogenase accessory factor
MSSWLDAAQELERSGQAYVVITVLGARGSTPRDNGTKMLVGTEQSFATIGGGHLEFKAIEIAREMLQSGRAEQRLETFPLGARLGQCCGGSASVLFESFVASSVNVVLFGAGHVGKALVDVLAQLPCRVTWVDSREELFPAVTAKNVHELLSDDPAGEVVQMAADSYYIVMTHNHPLDYAITEAVVQRGDAAYIGLIGSETKWKRFQMRFEHRGLSPQALQGVSCPVGLSEVPGKLPMEVAVSIAGEIIAHYQAEQPARTTARGVGWRELKTLVEAQESGQEDGSSVAVSTVAESPL